MKTISLSLLFILTSCLSTQAQFSKGEEVYRVYNLKLCATEVGTGTKKFSGTGLTYYETTLLTNPPVIKLSGDFLSDLGTYRVDYHNYQAGFNPLFNLSAEPKHYPLLDTIDIDFYRNRGLDKMLTRNPKLINDPQFKKLKTILRDSTHWPSSKTKDFIFAPENDLLRNQLIISRLDTIIKPFTIDKKKASTSTVNLKAALDKAIIATGVPLSATLTGYIHNLADINTKVHGFYYIGALDPDYLSRVQYYLRTVPEFDTKIDLFAYYLQLYSKSTTAAANTEIVALRIQGLYDRKTVNAASIAGDLSTKFGIAKDTSQALAVSLAFEFTRNETIELGSSFNNVYILRYFSSKQVDDLVFTPLRERADVQAKFK